MKNQELLSVFNKLLLDKNIPYQFSSWQEISSLTNEALSFIFNKITDLLTIEGIGSEGELNDLGLIYDEICSQLTMEMTRRKDFKLDVSNLKK